MKKKNLLFLGVVVIIASGCSTRSLDDIQEEMDILQTKAEQRLDEIMEAGENLKSSSITTEFMSALTSVDKQLYPARDAQYNFDLLFNYDRLISDYFNIHLQKGVV